MEAETQKKVELLKEKGLTIKEIKEILNLTNHDLYPENKEDPKSETAQGEEPKATETDDRFSASVLAIALMIFLSVLLSGLGFSLKISSISLDSFSFRSLSLTSSRGSIWMLRYSIYFPFPFFSLR